MASRSSWFRWFRWGALVATFVLAASALSAWQFDRREHRVAQIQLVVENYDRAPAPLDEVNWVHLDGELATEEWRVVQVSGRYLPDAQWLVRNRPLEGKAGFLQLAAFQLADGRIVMVERGWLPTGDSGSSPEADFEIGPEERTVTLRLRASETNNPSPGAVGDARSITSINLAYLDLELVGQGELITDFYGRLVSESPADAAYPLQMPKPSLSEGNHLSYALQWILFALLAVAALIWAVRREGMAARGVTPRRNLGRIAEEDATAEDRA
jgi:cytochrome oxidase assembly protein ShyY1